VIFPVFIWKDSCQTELKSRAQSTSSHPRQYHLQKRDAKGSTKLISKDAKMLLKLKADRHRVTG